MKRLRRSCAALALAALLAWPSAAAAQQEPRCPQGLPDADAALPPPFGARIGEYRENDFGGFRNVLPPGSNGLANACDLAAFMAPPKYTRRPRHNNDQLGSPTGVQQQQTQPPFKGYGNLVFESPGLDEGRIGDYFKDASFGVEPGDRERTYSLPPRKVSVVRDKGFGVPHVYGDNRNDAMFGLGYVAAEDRLFLIDVLRNLGRARISSFVGGTKGNRKMDQEQWRIAPYTEEDLQRQLDQLDDLYGEDGRRIQNDVGNYVDGVNRYIVEARGDRTKMPSEYAAINREGPEPWKGTDLVATASLVGGIFGKGGGRELDNALLLEAAQDRFNDDATGRKVFDDLKRSEDPEAPTTAKGSFPYLEPPSGGTATGDGLALPKPRSVKKARVSRGAIASGDSPSTNDLPAFGGLDRLRGSLGSASNALLVSGANSPSGHPVTVFGPQTSYFSPQILMEQDVHAPTLDARGATFPGVNLYVQLGRGRDYAWSATSAGQDITDTYAVEVCDFTDGDLDTKDGYRFRGDCEEVEHVERDNVWTPNAASGPIAGTERLVTDRTKLGLVVGRGEVGDKEVLYTALRSTYRHEIDSARGFSDYNDPEKMKDAADFKRASYKIGYTFNWFYSDDREISYFNSGNNPVRPEGIDHNFPVRGTREFEWRNFDPDRLTADYTSPEKHPQADDPPFLTSWNNKQAPDYRAADDEYAYGSVFRSEPLDDRIQKAIAGGAKIGLAKLVDAMEDAGTVDVRGDKVLPYLLEAIGPVGPNSNLAEPVDKLRAWQADGAHRRDLKPHDGKYEHSEAVAIMDAWWPKLLEAQFGPALDPDGTTPDQTDPPKDGDTVDDDQTQQGDPLFKQLQNLIPIDNPPNGYGDHHGSSYRSGWWSYVEKDLRGLFARDSVKGPFSRVYCGGDENRDGTKDLCGNVLRSSLADALGRSREESLYNDEVCEKATKDGQARPEDRQVCFDSILHAPIGGITQPLINWVNRPTFQQVLEIQGHRSRGGDGNDDGDKTEDREQEAGQESETGPAGVAALRALGSCLPRRSRVGSRGVGPLRLGLNTVGLLLRAGLPARSTPFALRYCVAGGGKVLVSLGRRGDARLVLATGRFQHARGVRPGDSVKEIEKAYPEAYRLGPGLRGTRRSSRVVFGIRRGRVQWVAVADRRLVKDPDELRLQLSRIPR